jgi:hypothetical protein
MPRRKNDFEESDKLRVLLWCQRHCCLCGIEIAHLNKESSHIDDAMPLCFDCHTAIEHYNPDHPKGKKYSRAELKSRRDQVYDEHTSHLVSPVVCRLTQLPSVRFEIVNTGDRHPVQARVRIGLRQGRRSLGLVSSPHYNGTYLLNLNPGKGFNGHFEIPRKAVSTGGEPLRARIDITLVDIYRREHKLLPEGYIHPLQPDSDWYFEPSEQEFDVRAESGRAAPARVTAWKAKK